MKSVSKPQLELFEFLKENWNSDIELDAHILNLRVDILDRENRMIIEYDGSGHNLLDKLAKNDKDTITNKKDYARDLVLKRAGYRIFRLKSAKDNYDKNMALKKIQEFSNSKKDFKVWQD